MIMEAEKYYTVKKNEDSLINCEKRIEELERLNEKLILKNRRLTQELFEKNNYILILDRADYEAKG